MSYLKPKYVDTEVWITQLQPEWKVSANSGLFHSPLLPGDQFGKTGTVGSLQKSQCTAK